MKDRKVLIVEDDDESILELSRMLKLSGYDPVVVNDQNSVLNSVVGLLPDIIFLNIKIAGFMNGFQIANRLKQLNLCKNIPLIAITGYSAADFYLPLMESCGIYDYLKKPFDPFDVIVKIETALAKDNYQEEVNG